MSGDRWTGHPWAPQDGRHDPAGRSRTWCSGCNNWCSDLLGCWCCNEPAHEYLLAEARWWAADLRHGDAAAIRPWYFPWEEVDG